MSKKDQKSAREGWFTLDANNPRLLGSQCDECQTYYFPVHEKYCRNPQCESESFTQIELSNRGKIWSYTNAGYAPPPPFVADDPYEVFALAAVELDKEKLVVLGQLVKGVGVDDVSIGDEVELAIETLYEDEESEYLVWKWKPVNSSKSSNTESQASSQGGAA